MNWQLIILFGGIIIVAMIIVRGRKATIGTFEEWCTDLQLIMHENDMYMEVSIFDERDWINAWYDGRTPEEAFNEKYRKNG